MFLCCNSFIRTFITMFQNTWSYALSKAIEVRLDSFKMDNEYNCVYAYKIIELAC